MQSIQRTRNRFVLGSNSWEAVKTVTENVDVHRELFDILVVYVKIGLLRLREFRNEDVAPHVYDRFIGAWSTFPHHDQVPLYFSRQIYVEFILHMRPYYTSMPLEFYGSGR